MDETIAGLIDHREQLRVAAAWLKRLIEGEVNTRIWHGDPNTFILETDTGECFDVSHTDPSLIIELAEPHDRANRVSP
jgi:hypothetical protein